MYNQIASNKERTYFLIGIFFVLIWTVGGVFGYYYGSPWYGIIPAIIISVIMALVSYYSGDSIALAAAHAKKISQTDNIALWRIVENLCITEGIQMPAVYCIDDPSINAFATGRDPKHASLAVTTGAIQKLKDIELEGVIAHELSHIKNYDILVMTIVVVLAGTIVLLAQWFFRIEFYGGGRSNRDDRNGSGGALLIFGFILMLLAPFFAQLIKLAISRQREYLADASGALLTRYPEGLAGALEKIAADEMPLASANGATAHMYFSNPFLGSKHWFAGLFSTHPPIQQRIARLRSMGA